MYFLKAFVKVNHNLLTQKRKIYRIKGTINAWIKDFLSYTTRSSLVELCQTVYQLSQVCYQVPTQSPASFSCTPTTCRNRLAADDDSAYLNTLHRLGQRVLRNYLDQIATLEKRCDMSSSDKYQGARLSGVRKTATQVTAPPSYTRNHGQHQSNQIKFIYTLHHSNKYIQLCLQRIQMQYIT